LCVSKIESKLRMLWSIHQEDAFNSAQGTLRRSYDVYLKFFTQERWTLNSVW
jgi:hypothetical protein